MYNANVISLLLSTIQLLCSNRDPLHYVPSRSTNTCLTDSAPAQSHALRIHLIRIRIRRGLGRTQLLRRNIAIRVVIRSVEVGHLVQDRTGLVVVIVGALRRELGETIEPVVGAGHDDIGRGHRVKQSRAVRAVAVRVGARDLGRRRLHVLDVVVDGLHLALHRRRLEPRREVIRTRARCGVRVAGHGDGVGDGCLQGRRLRARARRVGNRPLLDAGVEGLGTPVHVRCGDCALVGRDINGVGRLVGAGGELLEGRRSRFTSSIAEALDSRYLGLLDSIELVALGRVDRNGDGLARGNLLETV